MAKTKETLNNAIVNKEMKELENKNKLIDIEKFYVNGKLDNLEEIVQLKKKELVKKLEDYEKMMTIETLDDEGKVVFSARKKENPYLISNYFFKTINPLTSIEPEYSPEKLAIVWDLYMYLIDEVNMNVGVMQPTISHFCRFAGISTNTFKNYKTKGTLEMQTLVNKISDATFDSNVLLAQNSMLRDRSTIMRVKVENEVQEKPQVRVNVNVNQDVDLDQIASRLNEISKFKNTKNSFKAPIEVENYE